LSSTISDIQARKQALRRELRRCRRNLGPRQQRLAAQRLYRRLVVSPLFRFSRTIAFTLARDGEIDTLPLARAAWRRGKRCFLPVMSDFGKPRLTFREWRPGARLRTGRFGIPEPRLGKLRASRALSLVFLPLVGFDQYCNRLGMGRAYYDRSFAYLRRTTRTRPALVGLAHECQRTEKLELAPWDVPLQGIVTDGAWYHPAGPRNNR